MDIYESLGCEKIGPAAGEKLQKVNPDKIPEGWLVSEKLDGVSGILVDGRFFSLSGKPLSNTHLIKHDIGKSDLVIFGEIICVEISLEQLSGLLNPNTRTSLIKGYKLHFVPFDCVFKREYKIGSTATDYVTRYARLYENCLNPVTQYRFTPDAVRTLFGHVTRRGGEGVVIRNPNAGWYRGRRSSQVLKWVREARYDLKILDILEGKGKRAGTVGKVVVEFKGNPINADLGRGFNNKRRQEVWDNKEKYIGAVADVKAMRESSTGKSLRLPKVEAFRFDTQAEESKQ